jgi:hypothetical protein
VRLPWMSRTARRVSSGRGRRGAVAGILAVVALLLWATLAGGTQPFDTYESTVAADSPVAQYRLSDTSGSTTLADLAGSNTASNSGITLGGEGPFPGGKSGAFGGSSYASLTSNPLAGATSFTVEAWVDWTGGASYKQPIFDFGSGPNNYMYLTPASAVSSHKLQLEIHPTTGAAASVIATKLKASSWEYVAVTETGGTLTLYVNGEQVGQSTLQASTPASLGTISSLYLGKSLIAEDPSFNGSLSNIAFYTTALTEAQLKAHYYAGEFPVNAVRPTITGTPKDEVKLTAHAEGWTGLPTIAFSYQWLHCEKPASCANIPAAVGKTYEPVHVYIGEALQVQVTGVNAAGSGVATSLESAPVAALKPSNTTLPAISGKAEIGKKLSVSKGAWSGSPVTEYLYQWRECNSSGEACKNISGATQETYRIAPVLLTHTIRAEVTAKNSAGSATATSAQTAVVNFGVPDNETPPVITGTAQDEKTLTASTGTWAGTGTMTYAYQWERCNGAGESCTTVPATTATYGLGPSDVGSTMRVVVTATNPFGSTPQTSAATAVVTAAPPVNTAPPTISGTAQDGQTLTASQGTWTGTPTIAYAYQWERCNSSGESCMEIASATASTYKAVPGDVGHKLRATVTAANSVGAKAVTSYPTETVAALAPINTATPEVSGTAEEGQTLTASEGAWSGTPTIDFAYRWQRCHSSGESCSDIAGATGVDYTLADGDVGSTVRVIVTGTNSAGSTSASSLPSEPVITPVSTLCTDTWTGPAAGTWQTAADWSSGSVPTSADDACVGAGVTVEVTGGSFQVATLLGSGNLAISGGSLEVSSPMEESTIGGLAISGGSLGLVGELSVSSALSVSGTPTISGPGSVVVKPGGTGTLLGSCSRLLLDGVTLVNEGTFNAGSTGGAADGAIWMQNGAQLQNAGTFNANSYDPGCGYGSGGSAFYNGGGAASSITNTGTFQADAGSSAIVIPIAFDNQGTTEVHSGSMQLTGGGSGSNGTWFAQAGAALTLAGGSFSLAGGAFTGSGAIGLSSAAVTASGVQVAGANISLSGGSLTIPAGDELDVTGSLTFSGTPTISGPGSVVVKPGGTGTLLGSCSRLLLDGVTLVNEGTFNAGSTGGAADGAIWMQNGAQLQNAGTFNANSYDPGCGYGSGGSAFYNGGGAASSITNTGTFQADAGSSAIVIPIAFDNQGTTEVHSGTLEFLGGGVAGQVATGLWKVQGGALILGGGEFLIAEVADLSAVRVEGATVTRVPVAGPPRGSLDPHPDASGAVTITGSGEEIGSGFAAATVEVTAAGAGDWQVLCAGLTPGLDGSFGCEWSTTGGAYPDGSYELRAQLSDASSPPNTAPTKALKVLVDNTPPSGTLSSGAELAGPEVISGPASDSGSGVGEWQLQIAPEGSSTWVNGCPAQNSPIGEHTYQCTLETSSYANGAYQLRAAITDYAGNAYDTPVVHTVIHNTPPAAVAGPTIAGTAADEQALTATTGTWTGTSPLTYSYQWLRCDGSGGSCSAIAGATSATRALGHGDVGSTVEVTVTAKNVEGSAASTSAVSGVVLPAAPANVTLPAISGIAQEGETLTATSGSWNGTPPLTYAYQWQNCDAAGSSCVAISGATGPTLVPEAGSVGQTIRVAVTASNAAGASTAEASQSAVVADASPLNGAPPSIGGTAIVGDTLTGAHGSWSGTEPIAYGYQWQSCDIAGHGCASISGATASNYTPVEADVGHTLRLAITASNALGSTVAASAPSSVVQVSAGGSACTDTWIGAAEDGSWNNAGNWITGSVPGSSDHVCILTATTVAVTNATDDAGWITDDGTLELRYRGTLVLDGPSPSVLHGLAVEGGNLAGAGEADVTASFTGGEYGSLAGSGTLVLGPAATGTVAPTDGTYLSLGGQRVLRNEGSLTVGKGSGLNAGEGARLVNAGTFDANGEGSGESHGLIGLAQLVNTGTVRKTEGAGTTVIDFSIDNEGVIEADSGRIEFTNGGVSGQWGTDTWSAVPGSSIALNGFSHATYALGETVAIAGQLTMDASVTAGMIEAPEGELVSELGNLKLTGLNPSELASLTFTQPEENSRNEQNLEIATELDVTENIGWGSNDVFFTEGTLVAEEDSKTLFDPNAWVQIRGGLFINEGIAKWTSGGFQANESGTFFINRGTFEANQDGGNPFVQGCEHQPSGESCPAFENDGLFTAELPTEGWWPGQILWRVDIDNYGELDVPYEINPECKWEFTEVPGPGTEACYRAVREFKGLMVEDGARVNGAQPCTADETLGCLGDETEEEEPTGEPDASMYPEPEGESEEEDESFTEFTRQFSFAFDSSGYSETLCPSKYPCGKYKGASAASYAKTWDLNGESEEEASINSNRQYYYYGGDGGDCTNFASQALKAGGMRFMRAHGSNDPNGDAHTEEENEAIFLKGQGSWWSYYNTVPLDRRKPM